MNMFIKLYLSKIFWERMRSMFCFVCTVMIFPLFNKTYILPYSEEKTHYFFKNQKPRE